jgi:uncharacterized membrane protein
MTEHQQSRQTEHSDDAPVTASKTAHSDRELVGQAVTINRPVREVFDFFRNFENLPTFMENVERIDVIDDQRSHWVVKAPGNRTVEWDAMLLEEIDQHSLTWRSLDNADVANSGRVTFDDAGPRGTIVRAVIAYDPPGGMIGKAIAKMFQREPAIQARRDLRRMKQLLETGEIATAARNRAMHAEEKG